MCFFFILLTFQVSNSQPEYDFSSKLLYWNISYIIILDFHMELKYVAFEMVHWAKNQNGGQTVLVHHGPIHPICFGSNKGFQSFVVTAKIGSRAQLMLSALNFHPIDHLKFHTPIPHKKQEKSCIEYLNSPNFLLKYLLAWCDPEKDFRLTMQIPY